MNYRETRELLTISHAFGDIDDDEFITLYEAYSSKNLDFLYKSYPRFELEDLDEAECVAEFRFQKKDIPILSQVLRAPEVFRCRQGTVCCEEWLILAVSATWCHDSEGLSLNFL